jgi:hypothetical protein
MKISQKIKDLILHDNDFSLDFSKAMGIQQNSAKQLVTRDSEKLTIYKNIEFFKSKGFTLEEIFEPETETVSQ